MAPSTVAAFERSNFAVLERMKIMSLCLCFFGLNIPTKISTSEAVYFAVLEATLVFFDTKSEVLNSTGANMSLALAMGQ